MEPSQPELEEFSAATAGEVLKPVEAPSDGEGCPICLGQEEATETTWMKTACGHIFHGRCVERWLKMKGSCPVCRRQLSIPHVGAKQDVPFIHPFDLRTIESMRRFPHIFPDPDGYFSMYTQDMFEGH
ncbi:hypothetical protein CFC21_040461 [Triticum aestivum]|uniref:RING-type E3 ubiquitin transferase n=3 Tax=Triticum TaxID=4564 RepID=A0A9R1QB68_TRITD|nr:hypothetical protein CFC21_040461 [Triticum aestivum]VAH74251.1 unnamed protein product [Triticum turgidum subsp. durum]